jgi:predicted amidohydrolase YtcJ
MGLSASRLHVRGLQEGTGGLPLSAGTGMRFVRLAWLLAFVCGIGIAARAQTSAEVVFTHGKIWTENPKQPEAEAIALGDGKVMSVGDTAKVMKLAGPKTRIVDLRGRRVVPGFNDAHVHLIAGGVSLTAVQLRDAKSQAEFRQRIADYVTKLQPGEWVQYGEWDNERWTPATPPTHDLIDEVTPENPVFVERLDGHMAFANALAMKLAGVDRNTPDVAGGVIIRDEAGNPTGIFKDAARLLIYKIIPMPSVLQMEKAVAAAEKYAAQNGVTSVQAMWTSSQPDTEVAQELRVYQAFMQQGLLQLRISQHQALPNWKNLAAVGVQADFGNTYLHIGGVKGFADGSLGSHTAWLMAPYNDLAPGSENPSGLPTAALSNPEVMYSAIEGADKAGLQIAIHAIGDKANHEILNFYERLEQENGPRDRRLRIEHAQQLRSADIPRFGQLHVIASMQPLQLADDGRWAERRLGIERAKYSYAFRSLLDSGAMLAFGSDWPVAPMKPLEGIYAAVTRRTDDGKHPSGWIPEQKITVAEALYAYTMGSAFAEFEDDIKGSLEPGKIADLVVLNEDILHVSADDLARAQVEMTVVGGRVVYESKDETPAPPPRKGA